MKAWIEPDPDYEESNAYLEIEQYDTNGKFITGTYWNTRRLPWKIENIPTFDYTE